MTDAASNVTTYDYDTTTGRRVWIQNALGKKTYYTYNDRGQVVKQWGDTGYPIEKGYDSYGQMTTLKTYRAGTGWTASTWPTATTGTADTTTWAYQEATGLLLSKTDADSKAVTYTYDSANRLYTRTWARGPVTTYVYDSNTGEMLSTDYNDSTPDITFTYNRLGQQKTVSDAVVPSHLVP